MSVSTLLIFVVDEDADIQICCAFNVHLWNIGTVHHSHTQLEFLNWLRGQIPFLAWGPLLFFVRGFNLEPTANNTLTQVAVGVIQLTRLNGLLFERLPINAVESIVQINDSLANQVVTKENVIIISGDHDVGGTWKVDTEGVKFVELWTQMVRLVVVALIEDIFPALDRQVDF